MGTRIDGLTDKHVMAFRDALLGVQLPVISLPGFDPPIIGTRGINPSSRIQYNHQSFQILERAHEYTFSLPNPEQLEVSHQLYNNDLYDWRLFAYCKKGMLFSVNLTRAYTGRNLLPLRQQLRISTREVTDDARERAASALAAHLCRLGFEVTENREVVLGGFDIRKGKFVGTTAEAFVRDFTIIAVVKGHYMGNKGYRLPGLERLVSPAGQAHSVDIEGIFDPGNLADERQRASAEVVLRPGQATFRDALLKAYKGRCAVTSCDFAEVLEAAHICEYSGETSDVVENGLLLRVDVHRLFDRGHLALDSASMTVRVSEALKGTEYAALAGKRIWLPENPRARPSKAALDQHRKKCGL